MIRGWGTELHNLTSQQIVAPPFEVSSLGTDEAPPTVPIPKYRDDKGGDREEVMCLKQRQDF